MASDVETADQQGVRIEELGLTDGSRLVMLAGVEGIFAGDRKAVEVPGAEGKDCLFYRPNKIRWI